MTSCSFQRRRNPSRLSTRDPFPQQFQGGQMTKRTAMGLVEMGILDGGKVQSAGGQGVKLMPGAWTDPGLQDALQTSPRDFIAKIMDQLAAKGLSRQEQAMKVFDIFGRQTTQRGAHDFIRNFEQIGAETGRIQGAMGVDASKSYQAAHDIKQ